MILRNFHEKIHYRNCQFQKINIHPNYHFSDFYFKNVNLSLKMIMKFLEIWLKLTVVGGRIPVQVMDIRWPIKGCSMFEPSVIPSNCSPVTAIGQTCKLQCVGDDCNEGGMERHQCQSCHVTFDHMGNYIDGDESCFTDPEGNLVDCPSQGYKSIYRSWQYQ